MSDNIKNVLFLCTGNSARSLLAEAILNREGQGRFHAYSAGSQPTGAPNPHAIALLDRLNYRTDTLRSKSWDEFAAPDAPSMDLIFTVCDAAASETCPIWPGQPVSAHWGLPDPAAATGSHAEIALAFDAAYRILHNRIDRFANLPMAELDARSLRQKLALIGMDQDT